MVGRNECERVYAEIIFVLAFFGLLMAILLSRRSEPEPSLPLRIVTFNIQNRSSYEYDNPEFSSLRRTLTTNTTAREQEEKLKDTLLDLLLIGAEGRRATIVALPKCNLFWMHRVSDWLHMWRLNFTLQVVSHNDSKQHVSGFIFHQSLTLSKICQYASRVEHCFEVSGRSGRAIPVRVCFVHTPAWSTFFSPCFAEVVVENIYSSGTYFEPDEYVGLEKVNHSGAHSKPEQTVVLRNHIFIQLISPHIPTSAHPQYYGNTGEKLISMNLAHQVFVNSWLLRFVSPFEVKYFYDRDWVSVRHMEARLRYTKAKIFRQAVWDSGSHHMPVAVDFNWCKHYRNPCNMYR